MEQLIPSAMFDLLVLVPRMLRAASECRWAEARWARRRQQEGFSQPTVWR
jgi:hypothetical protein